MLILRLEFFESEGEEGEDLPYKKKEHRIIKHK